MVHGVDEDDQAIEDESLLNLFDGETLDDLLRAILPSPIPLPDNNSDEPPPNPCAVRATTRLEKRRDHDRRHKAERRKRKRDAERALEKASVRECAKAHLQRSKPVISSVDINRLHRGKSGYQAGNIPISDLDKLPYTLDHPEILRMRLIPWDGKYAAHSPHLPGLLT